MVTVLLRDRTNRTGREERETFRQTERDRDTDLEESACMTGGLASPALQGRLALEVLN